MKFLGSLSNRNYVYLVGMLLLGVQEESKAPFAKRQTKRSDLAGGGDA